MTVELAQLMKGGKDMRRIYRFEESEQEYLIFLDEMEKFKISKENLKIDGTKLYESFFDEYSFGDTIELTKGKSLDTSNKLSTSVYDTINKLFNDIIQKIDEQKEESQ